MNNEQGEVRHFSNMANLHLAYNVLQLFALGVDGVLSIVSSPQPMSDLSELKMIEFKATYHYRSKADSVEVLVQYDGVVLHVWHLSEPFHRLASSDEFHIVKPILPASHYTIKLSNGGRIRTADRLAFDRLSQTLKNTGGRGVCALAQNWVLAVIGSMSIAIGLWWLVSNGLLF